MSLYFIRRTMLMILMWGLMFACHLVQYYHCGKRSYLRTGGCSGFSYFRCLPADRQSGRMDLG